MSSQDDNSDTINDYDATLPAINEAGSESGVSIEQLYQLPDETTGHYEPPMTNIPNTHGIPDGPALGAPDSNGLYHLNAEGIAALLRGATQQLNQELREEIESDMVHRFATMSNQNEDNLQRFADNFTPVNRPTQQQQPPDVTAMPSTTSARARSAVPQFPTAESYGKLYGTPRQAKAADVAYAEWVAQAGGDPITSTATQGSGFVNPPTLTNEFVLQLIKASKSDSTTAIKCASFDGKDNHWTTFRTQFRDL